MQHRRNTTNTIRVLDKLLQDRWKNVVREASNETPSPQVQTLAGVTAGLPGANERAKVIWIKVRIVEAFPQSYDEVAQANAKSIVNVYIPPGQRKSHFTKYQSLLAGKVGGKQGESAACLLVALKTLGNDGVSLDDQLKYAISQVDDKNNPNPKTDALIDGWGNFLVFKRFDVSQDVQTANPAQTNTDKKFRYSDPEDPEGSLLNLNWYLLPPPPPNNPNPLRVQFESGNANVAPFHSIALAPPANPLRANYVLPTIRSAGKDNNLGTSDDIISIQLRGE
jgi:hypothetical protein